MPTGATDQQLLERLALAHHGLRRRVERLRAASPEAVLGIGAAVVFHGALEEQWLHRSSAVLEPAIIEQLASEHARLTDDLELLESLFDSTLDSSDLASLSHALLDRLRAHIARDDRVFYQSLPKLRGVPVRHPGTG